MGRREERKREMYFLIFTTLPSIHSRENKGIEGSSFSQNFGVSACASFFRKNDGAFFKPL